MAMMNVSLPEKQIQDVDLMVERYGYANRSEFVRSALRFVLKSKAISEEMGDFPFLVANPADKPDDVVNDFRETGKYSENFLKDLEEGLKKSKALKKRNV
ncbi:MAG TPA: ribbon-helix-helix domain-containing protein [Spirochaetia bacterium]|nr:ribbon-helix-helix domain-containing protein [Spirochaetia bacterium]